MPILENRALGRVVVEERLHLAVHRAAVVPKLRASLIVRFVRREDRRNRSRSLRARNLPFSCFGDF